MFRGAVFSGHGVELLLGPLQCYEKDLWNKNVFRWCRKDEGDVMETRLSGNAFQILAAAIGKARLPTVESLKGGTTRLLVPEERTRYIGNTVEWSQIPGRDATENFMA